MITLAAFLFGAATWIPDDVAEAVTGADGRYGVFVALWNEIVLILMSVVFTAFAARRVTYCFTTGFVVFAVTHCLLGWTSNLFTLHTLVLIAALPDTVASELDDTFFYFGMGPTGALFWGLMGGLYAAWKARRQTRANVLDKL
jgi:hypothetical protein